MKITVGFYSWFKDLSGCGEASFDLPEQSSITHLLEALYQRFPRLQEVERSTLIAVGVEYQGRDYVLSEGDEVSLFPPVQGG